MALRDFVRGRTRRTMPNGTGIVLACAAGAAAVALLESRAGARRRGRVVQKTIHAGKVVEDFGEKSARDLMNRSRGLVASARARLRHERASPEVLAERVRARLGRLTAHPGAIEVSARDDEIELRGPVLRAEADQVIRGVRKVRGVHRVVDLLERHEEPGTISALQGGAPRRRPVPEPLQVSWTPGTRLLAMTFGSVLLLRALRARGRGALPFGAAGALLTLRGATNIPLKRLFGVGAGRRSIDLRKTIHVDAPREEVFALFRAFENFPRFMTHVREVRRVAEGRWHWIVSGPGNSTVEWDAEVSAFVPNEVIGWKTVPGAVVESAGLAHFEDEAGGTRLDVRLSYNPPGGAMGHALAVLLGADPRRQMDDDLLRFKSLVERGKAEGVTREELHPERPQP